MEKIKLSILEQRNIFFICLDDHYNIKSYSDSLNQKLELNLKEGENFLDHFYEFIGLESDFEKLDKGKINKIILNKINRIGEGEGKFYLDFLIVKQEGDFIVLISDSTFQSNLEQKIQQQNNEIKILKDSLKTLKNNSTDLLIGKSNHLKNLKNFINRVAELRNTPILLTGESGTGKTLVAKVIHNSSSFSKTPFIEVNCASIPSMLMESELFGHIKGSFTSAVSDKIGIVEEANGGTLFLDEIGELPLTLQPKFLTFLETKKFRRIGSTKETEVDVRIITATNRDLMEMVKDKKFREDLLYRINTLAYEIPSLRKREEDILELANTFIKIFAHDLNKKIYGFTDSAITKILSYRWPGNIRELKNILERAVIFCDNELITEKEILISEQDFSNIDSGEISIPENGIYLEQIEKKYLETALKKANGNQTKAAKLLNISFDTMRYRLKKYNLT